MSKLMVYRDEHADLLKLSNKKVVVIGYGNQGRAQAQNLRDSGVSVSVASIRDQSAQQAESDGFHVIPIEGCASRADILMLLIPDEFQKEIFEKFLRDNLQPGQALCFGHGYNFHFGLIKPPAYIDVILVAPRMIGAIVRKTFTQGTGVPAYVAVGQDGSGHAKDIMLAIAKGIGSTRVGVVEMNFESETILDLFIEQTLMPIFTKSMLYAFEILVEEGFDPGVVTLEMYGSGEIAEVFKACAETGFYEQLFRFHSRTAQYGELSRKETILPTEIRAAMAKELENIRLGGFAKEWSQEEQHSFPQFNRLLKEARQHPINKAERDIAKLIDLGPSFHS